MSDPTLCDHVEAGGWPFDTELVLDAQLQPTDLLVRCRECRRPYLLELLDQRGRDQVMRISVLQPAAVDRLLHNLQRGSCDPQRAGAEVHHLRTGSRFAPRLLLVDSSGPRITALVATTKILPGASWRELPCDGSWVDYVRSKREIRNG